MREGKETRTFSLPVTAAVDVLVVGGGPAGVAAALSSARNGATTLLIERNGFLGGSATAAQVPAFAPFSDRTRAIVRGIGWEVMTEMQRRLGRPLPDPAQYAVPQDRARMDWVPIDVETLKRVYDDLCEAAKVEILFHTFVPEVIRREDGTTLSSVVLANKDGLSLVRAQVFVDATGDADVAARAGCPFHEGDDEGRTQGMTLCFTVAQGSREQYLGYVHSTGDGYLARLVAEARAAGDFDLPDASLVGLSFKNETVAGANMGHVYGARSTDTRSLSRAEREGRRVVEKLLPFLRRYVPGQENLTLISTGPQIGVRESRRIVGDYTLTLDDYLSCRTFADDIARCAYFIDLHAVTTEQAARARSISDVAQEKSERKSYSLAPGRSHGIPFRCLLPQGVGNLLVAGRSLSAERAVSGAVRVMPYGFATGEAAGWAAARAALRHGGDVRAVDPAGLRQGLIAQGAWLEE
ncbi:MAG: FAD-dependent oxidoreductase [Capsulimonadales bacterium]|nr:FAD-dependent oxidoreductase [Capsulimonadales bacterium]